MRPLVSGKQRALFHAKRKNEEAVISEQYRMIGTNIHFIVGDEKSNAILVTSPGKREGKSATAANIAVTMAQQGNEVLLIDANFRNPAMHKIFNTPNIFGFTDVLDGNVTFEDAVSFPKVNGLHILTSGTVPLNLTGQRAGELLDSVKASYNMVIIDSPSLLEANDSKILANICDGVVLVVKQNTTSIESALESKKILNYAQATLLGVVLNEKN
ncbi:CpsD/CapB family tyrosine-protein kinase [Siminovitchia fortis]|uniref:CpsD/CapB family tyrosine-protein kinase n=1 Tax=Siminovitchia fortis TaxID=254758 RepID=UPI001F48BA1C|nr:CpsD/CapB family tyrosine-protein kinase [Siminovitchia fortis]